jgi:prepilin-type N-terminal cleavage/methylation domain-containing protein
MERWRAVRGFTLAELLVSLALLGLLLAGVLTLQQTGLASYVWGAARVEAQQSARSALQWMAKELREAGYDPAGAGLAAIVEAEPARVTFQRDLNGNGVIDPTRERVSYLLRGTVLRRDAGGGAQPVIEGVRSLTLSYFDAAGARTADPGQVTSLWIQVEVGLRGPSVTMGTAVSLRNAGG